MNNKIIKGKRPKIYDTQGMDHLMHMVMVLAQELSATRDRLDTVEQLLAQKDNIQAADIEGYTPSQDVLESRETRRQNFMATLFSVMTQESAELAARDTKDRFDKVIEELATER
ncbi:hypothetical protein [Paraglaciecola sp. 2405UD69-4]|uniref:hypothetical protein n=1 Tax=Paraglaciecola sp. 2405UD69-4 TaxID=3391836 RepID=UPI0039C8C82D